MGLTEKQKKYIVDIYPFCRDERGESNTRLASEFFFENYPFEEESPFKPNSKTILYIWKENNLEIASKGGWRAKSRGPNKIKKHNSRSLDKYFQYVNRARIPHR